MKKYDQFLEHLRFASYEWFKSKGFELHPKHLHSLPDKAYWRNNIILPVVADYIELKGFSLHRYVHNGTSSQALAFNLIAPLTIKQDLEPLYEVLMRKGISTAEMIPIADFEYEDTSILNDATSVDVVLFDINNHPVIFIEAKLKETGFGKCGQVPNRCDGSNPVKDFNLCYLHRDERKYWIAMQKYGLIQGDVDNRAICAMKDDYQFFRNILFALEHEGSFVLLCDERNPNFYGESNIFDRCVNLVPERYHHRIARITIQELVKQIEITGRHEWVQDFKRKYGLV